MTDPKNNKEEKPFKKIFESLNYEELKKYVLILFELIYDGDENNNGKKNKRT